MSARVIAPRVRVPCLVEDDRVDGAGPFEYLGVVNRDSELSPLPLPTMIAVGVARPRAHGQAMMRTATAARTSFGEWCRDRQPGDQRCCCDDQNNGDEHAGDAVGEVLDRRLGGLGVPDQAGRSGPVLVSRPTFVVSTTTIPNSLTVAPNTSSPTVLPTGADSPVSMLAE